MNRLHAKRLGVQILIGLVLGLFSSSLNAGIASNSEAIIQCFGSFGGALCTRRNAIYAAGILVAGFTARLGAEKIMLSKDKKKDPVDTFYAITQEPSKFWFARKRLARVACDIDVNHLTTEQREKLLQLRDSLYSSFGIVRGKKYGAAVCVDENDCYDATFTRERAMLITGARVVTLDPEGPKFLCQTYADEAQRQKFKLLYKLENIQEKDDFAYRPEGERNYIHLMLSRVLGIGEGWFGYFLDYKDQDVEFFHQRMALNYDLPGQYFKFSDDQKLEFEQFKTDVWPKSLNGIMFEVDKICMKRWIDKQNQYNNQELMDRLEKLRREDAGKFVSRASMVARKNLFKNQLNRASDEERYDIIRTVIRNRDQGLIPCCLASENINPDMSIENKQLFDWCAEIAADDYAPFIQVCHKRGLISRLHEHLMSVQDHEVATLVSRLMIESATGHGAASSV
jgi:hypothetical protein